VVIEYKRPDITPLKETISQHLHHQQEDGICLLFTYLDFTNFICRQAAAWVGKSQRWRILAEKLPASGLRACSKILFPSA
jgi:hypothetical protein